MIAATHATFPSLGKGLSRSCMVLESTFVSVFYRKSAMRCSWWHPKPGHLHPCPGSFSRLLPSASSKQCLYGTKIESTLSKVQQCSRILNAAHDLAAGLRAPVCGKAPHGEPPVEPTQQLRHGSVVWCDPAAHPPPGLQGLVGCALVVVLPAFIHRLSNSHWATYV